MDSPLMPTLRGHHADSSDLLADLSLMDGDESLMPASPTAGGPPPSTLFATSSNRADATAGSSRSHLPPPTFLRGASRLTDPDDGQAPLPEIPNKPKPRFSLFAPLRPAGDAARSRSSRPAPAREDPAVREAEVEDDEDGEVEADQTIDPGQMRRGSGEDGAGSDDEEAEDGEEGNGEEDYTIHARPKMTAEERDDNLRQSLYELRNMNEVFDGFLDALESARGHNERLEIRVKQTKSLLDHYTSLLGQAHHTRNLLSDPSWTGVQDETARIEAEEAAREAEGERQRVEAERAAEAVRLEEEERARKAQEAAEAKERSMAQIRGRGRGRGWGGVGTGTRGARGTGIPAPRVPSASTRPGTGAGSGSSSTRSASSTAGAGAGAGTGVKRTVSGTGAPGVGGRYGHVQSSGYGASGRRAA